MRVAFLLVTVIVLMQIAQVGSFWGIAINLGIQAMNLACSAANAYMEKKAAEHEAMRMAEVEKLEAEHEKEIYEMQCKYDADVVDAYANMTEQMGKAAMKGAIERAKIKLEDLQMQLDHEMDILIFQSKHTDSDVTMFKLLAGAIGIASLSLILSCHACHVCINNKYYHTPFRRNRSKNTVVIVHAGKDSKHRKGHKKNKKNKKPHDKDKDD